MKRLLILALLLVLLTGCNMEPQGSDIPATDPQSVTETTGPAIYDPANSVEADTQGAVQAFRLEDGCTAVAVMNDHVLLFYGNTLRSYTGAELHLVKELTLQNDEHPGYIDVQINGEAMGFYDEKDHAVVILNQALKEVARVGLPADTQGSIVLTDTLDCVYYCTEDAIRCLNLKTGNSRMLRQQGYTAHALVESCFGGDILGCEVFNRDKRYVSYIHGETGELLGTSESGGRVQTGGVFYFTQVSDGTMTEHLFGKMGEKPQCLRPLDALAQVYPALELGAAFTATAEQGGLRLDYYDLETGARVASVTLPGDDSTINGVCADENAGCLWLLVENGTSQVLYRWAVEKSTVSDPEVYTTPRYTAENPDMDGLAQCDQTARDLGTKYGVKILVGDAPQGGVELTEEYLVSRIEEGLAALDDALSRYPGEVLAGINQVNGSGQVTLVVVRDIVGEQSVCQYWSGSDAVVVLELGDDMEGDLDRGLYHVLDTFLFNKTSALDQWDELNPKGFRYDMNDTDYLYRQEDKYLTGDQQAFADSRSMSYPMEDRAGIFRAAMDPEAGEMFASKTMQQKLLTLCKAIRNAFGWKKSEETYLWEQHLAESIAYKPKK